MKERKPDGILGTIPVQFSVFIQNDVHLQVSVIVVGREEVRHDPAGDPETTQDCGEEGDKSYYTALWNAQFWLVSRNNPRSVIRSVGGNLLQITQVT